MNNYKEFDDEIGLTELFAVIWLNKIFILASTATITLIALLISLLLTNIYTAQSLLTPTSSGTSSNLMSQYSGLASMAGINLPQGEGENAEVIAINLINSKRLLERLMLNESFLPDLLAAKKWNMQTNTIIYDSSLYDKKNNKWVRKVSLPFGQIPSSQEALKEFSKIVSISQDKKTKLVRLNVSHLSPVVAKEWSIWIVKEINTILANMQITTSQASIDYLNTQIKVTPYSELRTMFYQLIQESTQNMMLAKVKREYALTTIDPPVVPEEKSQPKRILIIIFATLLGFILSVLIILVRKYGFSQDGELDIFKLR
ncbi:MAG TPA: LPS O-antigen length regulator [Methylophilaceae bacterium]|nr:LPS O-antigen length regulator [Methylophilaceae bacterium]